MTAVFGGRENNEVKFTMEFTAEEFEAAIQKVYLKNRGRIAVDGFRKGKAPRRIIEARYGAGIFYEEAIDNLLQENYSKALDELNIDPIDRPSIDFASDEKIEAGKGFKVEVTAPVAPIVEIKDYKGIKAERELRKVEDDAVETQLSSLQKRNARVIDSEKEASWDDTVVLDYKGFIGEEQFEGGTADDYSLKLGSATFIPGFEAQLVGAKKGEEKDVVVTFPQDYHAENLAGKEAVFKCTIKEVKKEELPALDDEFAKDVSEFDTLEELKADILKKAQENIDKINEDAAKNAVMDKLCEANPIDIPAVMVTDEAEQLYNQFAQQVQMQGIDINMYCQYMGSSPEELKKGYEEQARKNVHGRMLLEAIAKAEDIQASEEDVDKELASIAEVYKMEKDKVRESLGEPTIKMIEKDIRTRKALDLVYENAKITEPKKAAKKPAKKAAAKAEAPAEEAEKPAEEAPKKPAKKTTKKAAKKDEPAEEAKE